MSVSVWADISLIWLLSLALVGILPIAVIMFLLVKGMRRLNQLARQHLLIATQKVEMVANKTQEISDKIANPFIKTYSMPARVRGMRQEIRRRNS